MPLMYPELGEAHKVHEVWLMMNDKNDTWVDISETIDIKREALRMHKSQVDDEAVKMVDRWAMESGKGLVPAEDYKVMQLVKREEPKPEA